MITDVFYIRRDGANYQYLNNEINTIGIDFGSTEYYKWNGRGGYFIFNRGSIHIDYILRKSYGVELIDPELFILYCKIKKVNDKRKDNTSAISS